MDHGTMLLLSIYGVGFLLFGCMWWNCRSHMTDDERPIYLVCAIVWPIAFLVIMISWQIDYWRFRSSRRSRDNL